MSRDGADQSGEEADGLGRFLGGKRDEVGLCQLDFLVHVIAGRLSLTSPAFRLRFRPDFADIVFCPSPRFLHTGGSVGAVMQRLP